MDLLTSIEGCTFEQAWRHRCRGSYGRRQAWFIGREELLRNKKLAARRKDRADVKLLHQIDLNLLRPRQIRRRSR